MENNINLEILENNIINDIIENTINNVFINDEKLISKLKTLLIELFTVNCLSEGLMSFSDGNLKISRRITSLYDVISLVNIIYDVIGDNEIYVDAVDINDESSKNNLKINIGRSTTGRIWVGEFKEEEEK